MAMTLRLDAEAEATLARLAQEQGTSKQQVIVSLIRAAGSREGHESRLRQIADRVKQRDAELLERLSQ